MGMIGEILMDDLVSHKKRSWRCSRFSSRFWEMPGRPSRSPHLCSPGNTDFSPQKQPSCDWMFRFQMDFWKFLHQTMDFSWRFSRKGSKTSTVKWGTFSSAGFPSAYSRLVLSFLGGPLKVTNLLQDQLVANWWPWSDMEFFCCWKQTTR